MRKNFLFDRRTFLKGAGATLALPLLETMSWAKPAKPPVRLGFMYMPHGVIMDEFWPATPESFLSSPPPALKSLRPVLDQFAQNLDATMRVSIVGHTDSTGSDAINRPLSMDRAQSVRDYLSYRGLAPARVDVSGRGASEPVADNGSEGGRAQNRRVQIFLREPAA